LAIDMFARVASDAAMIGALLAPSFFHAAEETFLASYIPSARHVNYFARL
jgi:hypothetical protein